MSDDNREILERIPSSSPIVLRRRAAAELRFSLLGRLPVFSCSGSGSSSEICCWLSPLSSSFRLSSPNFGLKISRSFFDRKKRTYRPSRVEQSGNSSSALRTHLMDYVRLMQYYGDEKLGKSSKRRAGEGNGPGTEA